MELKLKKEKHLNFIYSEAQTEENYATGAFADMLKR